MKNIVNEKDLAKVENNLLNSKQLGFLFKKTPENHIYKRPGKGGGQWDFVTGIYMKKVLNMIFGWNWDFQVEKFDVNMEAKQTIVLGKLTCRTNETQIIKMQFGRSDIKFKKNTETPLDLGNDLKAAATDALKKCASELGIAGDIYGTNEFKEIEVMPESGKSKIEVLKEQILIKFSEMDDTPEKLELQKLCSDKMDAGEFTVKFANNILSQL